MGELQIRGPWVATEYYKDERAGEQWRDGWLKTGDVGVIDSEGYLQLVDRAKDLVKSGGEWISSVDLEGAIMGHPKVLEAAVDILEFLQDKVAHRVAAGDRHHPNRKPA